MRYLIDGYNFLFALADHKDRKAAILWIQNEFATHHLKGVIVFDREAKGESVERQYPSPLQVIYVPSAMSADEYLIEILQGRQNSPMTLVTNDRALARAGRELGAKTIEVAEFLRMLEKKGRKGEEKTSESDRWEMERWLRLFEGER